MAIFVPSGDQAGKLAPSTRSRVASVGVHYNHTAGHLAACEGNPFPIR